MKKGKVLITWYSKSIGGAEESIAHLCNELVLIGDFKIIVLFNYSDKKDNAHFKKIIDSKVKLYSYRCPLRLYGLMSSISIFYLFWKERFQIIDVGYRGMLSKSLVGKILGCKIIATIRAIPWQSIHGPSVDLLMKKEAKLQKGYSNKNSFNFWFVDFVIAISEAVKIGLINNYEIKNITVIHNGIDVDTYPPSKRTESMRYRIYFMARNVKWKRVDWFVRAAKKIHDIYPQTKFGIFGYGPEDENIRKLIKEMDSQNYIRMYGFIDRYDDRLDEYGIYVISSYMEPFGKTVLEALFMNKVVVGTNAGGIPEILPDYKLLFERDSFEDFVLKLKNAILNYDYYYNQINEIRVRFKNYYSMKRVGQEYNKAYKLLPK